VRAARTGPYLRGAHTLYRAEIAALLGQRGRALDLLRDAVSHGMFAFSPSVHAEPAFTTLRGDPAFEALFRPKD
jgi:hypothetical protein